MSVASKQPMFDSVATAFLAGFMSEDNPQFAYWLPKYTQTLQKVRTALERNQPDDIFALIWKEYDNSVSNAGQGIISHVEADRLRPRLVKIIRDIHQDGSAASYDMLITRMEQWRERGELNRVPRLLLARAFAAIHPELYHTTVDGPKQARIIPWLAQHMGFVAPPGNWAAKAAAVTAHLERSGVFGEDHERRNIFPWYVYDQLRDTENKLVFRPGHNGRPEGSQVSQRDRRTLSISRRHNAIQNRLFELLAEKHGEKCVASEHATGTGGRADILVKRKNGQFDLYEIKPAQQASEAVRQAIGQLLEYSYWRDGLDPESLHVVSDAPLDAITREYLLTLKQRFGLDFKYLHIPVDGEVT